MSQGRFVDQGARGLGVLVREPRLAFLATAAFAWCLALVARLYGLQILEHEHYQDRAANQQRAVVELSAPRGTIRDARGRELAVSLEVQSIYADPVEMRRRGGDPETVAAALAERLGASADDRRRMAAKLASDKRFVWLARKADPPAAEAVLEAGLPGIHGVAESRRYYPMRSLAAHVLGFVGVDDVGLGGVEAMYDKVVGSEPGRRVVVSDGLHGRALHPSLAFTAARSGLDLDLTIDSTVQQRLEQALERAVDEHNADGATAVVMNPWSGAVLAMASWPTFDPNRFGAFPESRWRNPAISDAFEPGSTFKMITLAAALERGAVDLDTVYDCEMGALRRHGTLIRDHKPFGVLSVRQVLAKSSNVGAMKLSFAAGRETFHGTMRAFGIGKLTGIDLPGESAGLLRPIDRWQALTPAYFAFGQGLSTTALQMAVAFSTVANGGHAVRPYVVAKRGGVAVERPRGRRVIRAEVAETVRSALESVVLEGTGEPAQVAAYRVAGKTGTAEKAIGGRYAPNQYVASFIGFVPADDPELVIAIVVDEPWPTYHGSQAAAPVFAEVAGPTLLDLGVLPRREPPRIWPGEQPPDSDFVRARFDDAPRLMTPDAMVSGAAPEPAPEAPPGTVPRLVGLSKRQAVRTVAGLDLELRLTGSGYVDRQSPAAGTPLELSGGVVEVWLDTAARPMAPAVPAANRAEGL